MANPNVIDYAQFGKYSTHNTQQLHTHFVREDEGKYENEQLLDKIQTLLEKPLWPQFPDGAYLNPTQAARLYRATQGIQGLTHILDRSAQVRSLSKDYDHEPSNSLSETQEIQLRAGLIEIGTELVNLADDFVEHFVDGQIERARLENAQFALSEQPIEPLSARTVRRASPRRAIPAPCRT